MCVCVKLTSGGAKTLATPAYQGRLSPVSLPQGAAVNEIKSVILKLPCAKGRPFARLHPLIPRNCNPTNTRLQNPVLVLILIFNNCRAQSALRRREQTCLLCQFQVCWLVPSK
jgi:hypothetical protein